MADTAVMIHHTGVPTYGIGIVGAPGTGKSEYLKKVMGESNIGGHETTEVAKYNLDGCCKGDKVSASLACLDVPGSFEVGFDGFKGIEDFGANSPLGIQAFLVFHDVTDSSSYSFAQDWCKLITTSVSGHRFPVAICGNKMDLSRNNEVATKVVGLDNQIKHFEFSVKTDPMISLQAPLLYLITELKGPTKVEYLKAHAVHEHPAEISFDNDLEAQNGPAAAAVQAEPVARDDGGWFGTLNRIKECCMCCAPLVLIALKIWDFFFPY